MGNMGNHGAVGGSAGARVMAVGDQEDVSAVSMDESEGYETGTEVIDLTGEED